jgi:cysteinyl-tRNA synthetase
LWKQSSAEEPGWDSPWGRGRPGWHIECSAMSAAYLGEVFDIHAGGLDLIFPHHENEIAQSRCAHGTPAMANYWMHNGFLQVEGQKMSKSLGNFVTINDLLETDRFGGSRWSGQALRLTMLKTHYRSPIDWTVGSLRETEETCETWSRIVDEYADSSAQPPPAFINALCNDLNTPEAIAELYRMYRRKDGPSFAASLKMLGLHLEKAHYTGPVERAVDSASLQVELAALIEARAAARVRKDWAESDRIRDELAAMGVTLKDGKDSDGKPVTTWEIAR